MPRYPGIRKLYFNDDELEDVPLSFDCHATIVTRKQPKPSPRLEKIKAAIKYFFSMKK